MLSEKRQLRVNVVSNVNECNTVNPRIIPLGAYLFFIFLDGGLFEGGLIRGGGGG